MKTNILWLGFILLSYTMFAQEKSQVISISSGDNVAKMIPVTMQWVFPGFTKGTVYQTGGAIEALLNYNTLTGEIMFITPKSDTLALDNLSNVSMVNIEGRKFYPFDNKELTEELVNGKVRLRVRYKGKIVPHSKDVAYGGTSSTSAVSSSSTSTSASYGVRKNISVKENVFVKINYFYYLVSASGKYTLVKNQKSFTKIFPKSKAQIEAFVKENDISFNNGNDLISLLLYCNSLE